jgi:predicted O-methyltransferase YrrM
MDMLATPPHKIPGHFYSPIVDAESARVDAARIWPRNPTLHGIDFNDAFQRRLLAGVFPRLIGDYAYSDDGPDDDAVTAYYENNGQFSHLDSRAAFCLLRHLKPRRIVEVGSGYSTLLMQDVNRRFLGGACQITCIEPYPRPFLLRGDIDLIRKRVQDVPLDFFAELGPGDVLFIDSSHVCKTGSDVAYLLLEVLPRLRPGVLIHVHDIFLPGDYPQQWVLDVEISWNEQYVLQALLTQNRGYRVVFGSAYAAQHFAPEVNALVGRHIPLGGSSLWIERQPHRMLFGLLWRLRRWLPLTY